MKTPKPRWQNVAFIIVLLVLAGVALILVRSRMNW
jgi:hypothetical protein